VMDPTDLLNLADIRAELRHLITARKARGVLLKDMAARNGHQTEFMQAPWDEARMPWDWKWSTFYGLVDGAGLRACVEMNELPHVSAPLFIVAKSKPVFGGIGALEYLKVAREDKCVSQLELSRRLGIAKSGINKIEKSDDPRMSTIMRYARALDGYVRFRIKEVEQ
jgi:DNA-binding XRE family transcriptional regulator